MFWVCKRTVSMRSFFKAPQTKMLKLMDKKNIANFTLINFLYLTYATRPFKMDLYYPLSVGRGFTGENMVSGHSTCVEYLRSVGGTISLSSLSFRGKGLPYVVMRSISLL